VHAYTAAGAVIAFVALEAVARADYRLAFLYLAGAMLIDCTDGTLARRFRVKDVLPSLDGARLDDIVDYLNYVLVPVVLARHAGLLPPGPSGLTAAACPLLASAYGFCQTDAKTPDHYFKGFPSYWNVVVFYFYALQPPPWVNALALIALSVLVFVPTRYLYPSRSPVARKRIYLLGTAWGILVLVILLQRPNPSRGLALLSLSFPAYYLGLSLHLHLTAPRAAESAAPLPHPDSQRSPATVRSSPRDPT